MLATPSWSRGRLLLRVHAVHHRPSEAKLETPCSGLAELEGGGGGGGGGGEREGGCKRPHLLQAVRRTSRPFLKTSHPFLKTQPSVCFDTSNKLKLGRLTIRWSGTTYRLKLCRRMGTTWRLKLLHQFGRRWSFSPLFPITGEGKPGMKSELRRLHNIATRLLNHLRQKYLNEATELLTSRSFHLRIHFRRLKRENRQLAYDICNNYYEPQMQEFIANAFRQFLSRHLDLNASGYENIDALRDGITRRARISFPRLPRSIQSFSEFLDNRTPVGQYNLFKGHKDSVDVLEIDPQAHWCLRKAVQNVLNTHRAELCCNGEWGIEDMNRRLGFARQARRVSRLVGIDVRDASSPCRPWQVEGRLHRQQSAPPQALQVGVGRLPRRQRTPDGEVWRRMAKGRWREVSARLLPRDEVCPPVVRRLRVWPLRSRLLGKEA
ncbi:uncharacterized protein [Triticum aestivum]|uniref:uncharacterized protein isoform X2 n=1 Tax=Triticum aestivum TaxID=4565 RepID=UPI001D00DFD2|nr:uncharacterized protein LOC123044309 isoform X2 [Triticum aestivum]